MLHTPICDYFGIKYPILLAGWSASSVFRGREGRHYRHEGSAVSRHAPDCGQQFSHRGDDGDLSWFACSSEPFVVLPQPRITPHHL